MLTPAVRRAFTLLELLVVLTLGGVVLALFTALGVRQQRLYADLESAVAGAAQLRQTASLLPIELRAVAPRLGDLAPTARDTAVQFRATTGSAVVCDVLPEGLLLASATRGPARLASFVSLPVARDTAWVLRLADASETWVPAPVEAVSWRSGCSPGIDGPVAAADPSLFVKLPSSGAVRGTVVRFTRPVRYSLYRASDARWYLGQREWNPATAQFNAVQPVSGPFARAADGGMRITYRRGDGTALDLPLTDPAAVEIVDIVLRADLRPRRREAGASPPAVSRDSIRLVVRFRNS